MIDPTRQNNRTHREFLQGNLLKAGKTSIVEIPFMYSSYAPRQYNAAVSALPGFEYVLPYEQIRTTRLDLPFAKGDKIKLCDGRTMTVENAMTQIDNNKGYMSSDIRTAWVITLSGGGE